MENNLTRFLKDAMPIIVILAVFIGWFSLWNLILKTIGAFWEGYSDNQPAPKKPNCKIGTWDE
jgi:hypothetical protein